MPNDRDKNYIRDHANWLVWPFCPLTRRRSDGSKQLAYMLAGEPNSVYFGNFLAPKITDLRVTYPSLDELIADGWEVD